MKDLDISITHQTSRAIPNVQEIEAWLASKLAEFLDMDPGEIDVSAPFDRYGLDSYAAVGLISALEEWLGRELSPTLPYEYVTIESLAQHLIEECYVAS
jgi:acyl carrier protein